MWACLNASASSKNADLQSAAKDKKKLLRTEEALDKFKLALHVHATDPQRTLELLDELLTESVVHRAIRDSRRPGRLPPDINSNTGAQLAYTVLKHHAQWVPRAREALPRRHRGSACVHRCPQLPEGTRTDQLIEHSPR